MDDLPVSKRDKRKQFMFCPQSVEESESCCHNQTLERVKSTETELEAKQANLLPDRLL